MIKLQIVFRASNKNLSQIIFPLGINNYASEITNETAFLDMVHGFQHNR